MSNPAIGIEVSGEFLELDESVSIDLVLISPLFSDELGADANSHSFLFTIPWTTKNQKLLDFRDSVLKDRSLAIIDSVFYLFGMPWKTANLIIKSASRSGYSVRLEMDQSLISRKLSGVTLREFDYGGIRVIDSNAVSVRAQAMSAHAAATAAGGFDYVFFQYENLSPGESIPGSRGLVGNSWTGSGYEINFDGGGSPLPDNEFYLTPFVYLQYVLSHVFESLGLTLDQNSPFFQDPELASLVFFNPVAIDELIDLFVGLQGNRSVNQYAGSIEIKKHLPNTDLKELVIGVMKLFCCFIDLEEDGYGIYFRKGILDSADTVDWTKKGLQGYFIDYDGIYSGFQFFSEQDEKDGETEPPTVQPEGFTITGTVINGPALPTADATNLGQIYFAEFEDTFFQCVLTEGSDPAEYKWIFYSRNLYPLTVGTDPTELTSIVSTVHMPNPGPPKVQVFPNVIRVAMPLASYAMPSDSDLEFSPRLMFYRGQEIGGPQGGVTDLGGEYDYSLLWHGDAGLYQTWWKDWAEFLMSAKINKIPLKLTPRDLIDIDWKKRVRIIIREGEVSGFLRQLNVKIDMTGIRSVDAEVISE